MLKALQPGVREKLYSGSIEGKREPPVSLDPRHGGKGAVLDTHQLVSSVWFAIVEALRHHRSIILNPVSRMTAT